MEKVSFSVFREHGSELCTCRQLITGVTKIMCNTPLENDGPHHFTHAKKRNPIIVPLLLQCENTQ
jgi:hypothetical protein